MDVEEELGGKEAAGKLVKELNKYWYIVAQKASDNTIIQYQDADLEDMGNDEYMIEILDSKMTNKE